MAPSRLFKNRLIQLIIYILIIFFCAILQNSTFLNSLRIASVKPNLILIIIVYFGLKIQDEFAYLTGFIGGLFLDIFSIGLLGLNCFTKTLIAYLVTLFKTKIYTENVLSISIFMLFFSLTNGLGMLILKLIFTGQPQMIKTIITESIYNSIVTPILFLIIDRLLIITGRKRI